MLAAVAAPGPTPSAREYYNQGLQRMQSNDLHEAENNFLEAAKKNQPIVQPLASYNLGHVRFLQGKEILSGEGNRQQLLDGGEAAMVVAREALGSAKAALQNEEDLRGLVNAYNEARMARKTLRTSRDETSRATALVGSAMSQWRKSANNFYSAYELDASNTDAEFNARVMEQHINELVKFEKKLQQQAEGVGEKRKELSDAMKKMRGKIPKSMQRENDGEEDDDDEEDGDKDKDKDKGAGDKEEKEKDKGAGKQQEQRLGTGREIDPDLMRMLKEKITPRTMSPDGGADQQDNPRGRKGRDW